ncbi:hypothetical protein Pst134EB_026601 [Puccinia striiformis f. sp. tritici]|nr:hypothetical protein Pst134EB_026601 [Puccinia striiformis f. sp. tritici]
MTNYLGTFYIQARKAPHNLLNHNQTNLPGIKVVRIDTPNQGSAKKKRSSNSLPAEEEQLTITSLCISKDSKVGKNQTGTIYYKKMKRSSTSTSN